MPAVGKARNNLNSVGLDNSSTAITITHDSGTYLWYDVSCYAYLLLVNTCVVYNLT